MSIWLKLQHCRYLILVTFTIWPHQRTTAMFGQNARLRPKCPRLGFVLEPSHLLLQLTNNTKYDPPQVMTFSNSHLRIFLQR